MAAEKRKVVRVGQKKLNSLLRSVSFLSFFDCTIFLIFAILSFFVVKKGDKVCVRILFRISCFEGGTRGTHRKRFVLSFFPPHKNAHSHKNLKTHTHARHHLATTTTTTGGGDDDDDDRKIV
jgi:hypothetical protein